MNASFLDRIERYLEFARNHPKHFQNNSESVKIILDPYKIYDAEKKFQKYQKKLNLPEVGSQVGIISQDQWVTVMRDAVEFSDGDIRLHTRVMNRANDGVAILPIFDKKIILIRHFRHALRKSILEIPRGAIEDADSPEDTVKKELLEEIQGVPKTLISLGFVYGSTNLFANGSHLYYSKLESLGEPQTSEGIESIERLTLEEFENYVLNGKITEAFTIAAFLHTRLRGLL